MEGYYGHPSALVKDFHTVFDGFRYAIKLSVYLYSYCLKASLCGMAAFATEFCGDCRGYYFGQLKRCFYFGFATRLANSVCDLGCEPFLAVISYILIKSLSE